MSSFTIVVDSNCDLPPEYLEAHGIEMLPMPFDLDDRPHVLGRWQEISGKDYYDALRRGSVARTTLVNREAFVTAFTEYARQGKDVLFLILSGGLSATYQNAEMALREVKETYPDSNIYAINTLSASTGHGLLAMLAVKKRGEGLSAGETAAWLEEKKHSLFAFFSVEDLMYLHRGGRLSKLSAIVGSMLGVRPMLMIAPDGTLTLKEKVRGRKAALALMVRQIKRSTDPNTAFDTMLISHTDCPEDARILADMIKTSFDVRDVVVMMMGPVIGAHLGPDAITLVFEGGMTRGEYEAGYYGGEQR